jgi:hypothetical protein
MRRLVELLAWLARRLQLAEPELVLVAAMRLDVIGDGGRHHLALAVA